MAAKSIRDPAFVRQRQKDAALRARQRQNFRPLKKHLIIPDTQCGPGTPTQHLTWIGKYILDKRPDVIVHLGDHWDMHSLSIYDMGKRAGEGARYDLDIRAGNAAMDVLMLPLIEYNRRRKPENQYKPRLVFLLGNHEQRIERHINSYPVLEHVLGYHHFNLVAHGWEVQDFLKPIVIDGISYAHYFYQPNSGKPYGGTAHTKIKNIGHSFTMGHQQGLDVATRTLDNGKMQWGLVAGSCYLHDEDYKGPQANYHWRGIVMKHEVKDGGYNPMLVSLDYLQRRYG